MRSFIKLNANIRNIFNFSYIKRKKYIKKPPQAPPKKNTPYYNLFCQKSKIEIGRRLQINGILRSESFCSIIDICSLFNKDANVAYVIEKNEFDEPGHVK